MFNVGRMPEISAAILQKAYRRYRVRCKLQRLRHIYDLMQLMKEEENYKSLRDKLRNVYCYSYVKTKKFEKYRKLRMIQIKLKLALLKIKQIFRKLRLKFPVIIMKIKKYKRRLRAALKRKMRRREALVAQGLQELLDQTGQPIEAEDKISINSEEDFETTTSDREAEEREQLLKRMEEDRKMRIHFGKISYNCPELKLPKILTSLHQKEVLATEPSPVIIASISPVKRKIKLSQKIEIPHRKVVGEEPSYMRSTVSYSLSRHDAKEDFPVDFSAFSKISPREKSTVMEPTKAYLLKVAQKRSLSTDEGLNSPLLRNIRTSSPKLISVSIEKKRVGARENFIEANIKSTVIESPRAEHRRFSMTLPDISTRYNQLPLKVKPRAQMMKGFARTKKAPEYLFDI